MDDLVTGVLITSSAFFVVLSLGLMVRYRQVSQRIAASSELGRDLWQTLEQRLKKQDERILDMMARFEVVQARIVGSPVRGSAHPQLAPPESSRESLLGEPGTHWEADPKGDSGLTRGSEPRQGLDKIQRSVIELLGRKAMDTIEIKESVGVSREHTARIMKSLFDRGLVTRNESEKPFVYQLSDEGRRYLSTK